ncbi:oligosaccharide flippase family protein [Microbacterium sp. NE2HP2]|uniref:oligosaccharide flippase family protein n=1 Tax=Microbacterium plantarum TaxID=1816425 RepID=UPI00236584C8|nr:oligosaccharide flippase family protein [Microbacterium plantarum]MDD7945819.1 oligosaccharide flippase family protein [Microbacterium plantarum]
MNFGRRLLRLLRADTPSLLLVGRLGATSMAFITAPIVARSIGADGRGETAAAIALFNLVPILLGIGMPLEVRRLAARAQGDAAIRTARLLVLLTVPFALVAAWAATVSILSGFDTASRVTAFIGIALCPLMIMWTCDSSVLVASGRYKGVMTLQLIQPAAYLVLVIAFASTQTLTVATALISNLAGTVAACITGLSFTRVTPFGPRVRLLTLLRGAVRYAGSSIAEAAASRLDQVIALPLIGAFQAGIYSVAVTVASIPLALGQALGAATFPLVARSEGPERQAFKAEAVRMSVAVSIVTAPLLGIGTWIVIPLLFGPDFEPAVVVSWVAGAGTCALIIAYVCSMNLAAEGRGYTMTVAQACALALSIALLYALAPNYGALGAAAASTVGYFALMVTLLLATRVRIRQACPGPRDLSRAFATLFRQRP